MLFQQQDPLLNCLCESSFCAKWKSILDKIALDDKPLEENDLVENQLKIAFVKKRLLLETIQDVCLSKGKQELDLLALGMQQDNFQSQEEAFSSELLLQQARNILDRRIQSLRTILPLKFEANIPLAEILSLQKREIMQQAKKLLIQVFHGALARCATSLRTLEALIQSIQQIFHSDQLIVAYKNTSYENLVNLMLLLQNIAQRTKRLRFKLETSLFSPANLVTLHELQEQLQASIQEKTVKLKSAKNTLAAYQALGANFEKISQEIHHSRQRIIQVREEIVRFSTLKTRES